jgi:sugar lactone lactonase YvrE
VRRGLGVCAVAVTVCGAMALFTRAQSGAPTGAIVVTGQPYPSWSFYRDSAISLPRSPLTVVSSGPPSAVTAETQRSLTFFSLADAPNTVQTIGEEDRKSASGELTEVDYVPSFVAGNAKRGFSGDGGDATDAELSLSQDSPVKRSGIAVAADGTLYVADTKNSTIRAVASATSSEPGIIRSVAGKWGPAQNVQLVEPMGVAADRAGNLYIADHTAGTVTVLTKATGQLNMLAHVASPGSLAVTTDGAKVFVASPETGGVFAITTLRRSIAVVPGFAPAVNAAESTSSGPCAAVEAAAAAAPAKARSTTASGSICPAGLAVDGRGNLFVADANSGQILRVDATSSKKTEAVVGMLEPGDIAFDSQGDLFISEQGRNRILAIPEVGDPASNLTLTAPAPPACPQGASFTYCNEPSGGTSASFTFTLMNNSASPISGITITPAFVPVGTNPPPAPTNFTTTSTTCTSTLSPGTSCTINVAFTPLAAGPIQGQLSVSDSVPSDTQSISLTGTGDDFGLTIVNGQPTEVTASQGNTATFMAQLNADSIFGLQGETVELACPANLPEFTTCEFQPCPLTPVVGGSVPFSILINTSTKTDETPPIPNPCNSMAAGVRQHRAGAPSGVLFITTPRPPGHATRFPALMALLAALILAGFASVAVRLARPGAGRAARRAFAAIALLAAGSAAAACHGNKNANSTATPTGVTNMNVVANAFDSSGNSMNASRGLQITLDVIQQQATGPLP